MEKKLPKVYANKIDHEVGNNSRLFYGNEKPIVKKKNSLNVNQKINQIFGSSRYVYKADVVITLESGKISKKIIGRNKNALITIDNESIDVSNILDIDFEE